jgi:hypothetical protein
VEPVKPYTDVTQNPSRLLGPPPPFVDSQEMRLLQMTQSVILAQLLTVRRGSDQQLTTAVTSEEGWYDSGPTGNSKVITTQVQSSPRFPFSCYRLPTIHRVGEEALADRPSTIPYLHFRLENVSSFPITL